MSLKNLAIKKEVPLPCDPTKNYDAIIVGGGTGGLTFAEHGSKQGLSIALFDHIVPTPHGTTWGLGGTCVNVGCIPKKLFHISNIVKENILMADDFGWKGQQDVQHDWNILRDNIQNYIKAINYGYINKLRDLGVDYINSQATFSDSNTLEFNWQQKNYKIQAKNIILATGVRPRMYPGVPELKSYGITSDDLFSLKRNPGKTLIIGGGYIAIECAGFLAGFGNEVTLVNRSVFMRVFDQDMAQRVIEQLEEEAVDTKTYTNVKSVKELRSASESDLGEYEVEFEVKNKGIVKEKYNTILVAIGRDPNPDQLQYQKAGLEIHKNSKKFIGSDLEREQTNIPHIYAVGDCLHGVPELMPVAQKSGRLLAKRISLKLQNKDFSHLFNDYSFIPTTIFAPVEYSFIGLNEEEALKQLGEDNIDIYHRELVPLQYGIYKNNTKTAYMKTIVSKNDNEKIIGIHYLGPSADEMIAGFAIPMKMGFNKKQLDQVIGIHPSTSEDLYNMEVTKRSGEEFRKTEC